MSDNINFDPQGGSGPPLPSQEPSGTAAPGFGAPASSASSTGAPTPMQLAASSTPAAPTGPVNEYEEPPAPTVASAPSSPVPPGPGGTLTNFAIKGNQLTVSLNLPTSSSLWLTQYTYTATVTPAQIASLARSGASSMAEGLANATPPLSFKCTSAMNSLTKFPSNMALFAKEFPYEYHKFMVNLAIQIFQQVHTQQDAAVAQMKQTMQQMESD
jgi:hypothetical protein